ncbi:MAG TPA: Gldg family protein [Gemmatimonadales bacterium]|nr:Gldg family protein [Gemmatimonadales bacterium]
MSAIRAVARRELRALFDQPTAYILLIVFIGVNDFLCFRQIETYGAASLRPMLDLLPWLLLFLVPAVTMRALAEDTRSGIVEVVLAQPITELELLLGKYAGQVLFLWIALAATLPIPLGLALGARMDVGILVAQYAGSALLMIGLAGIGVWSSSVTRNQVTAFIVGVAVMFAVILLGLDPLLVGLPPALGTVAETLGVLPHFQQIARGVIDLRDAIYFLTLAAIFLSLAYLGLVRRKLAPRGEELRRLRLGTVLTVGVLVVLNLFGRHIGGRLDLTPGRQYTLSRATRDILRRLPDLVTIKLFASSTLPPEVAFLKRDVDDLLGDYRAAGRGKVRIVVLDPTHDSAAAREAEALQIPPVQFNVLGQGSLQVKEGYLGLAVQFASDNREIAFIRRADDLEYRLTSFIRELTLTSKPAVGWIQVNSGPPGPAGVPTFSALRDALGRGYDIRDLTLAGDTALPAGLKVLVLSGSVDSLPAKQSDPLKQYLAHGGSALVMASGTARSPQAPMAMGRAVGWNELIRPAGVAIRPDMAYDLAANAQVSLPSQFGQVILPYPLWPRGISTKATTINAEVSSVLLPWTSSIDTTGAAPGTVTPLVVTSRAGGLETQDIVLSPQQPFPREHTSSRLLAVQVLPKKAGAGRLVVVGNSDFVSDRYVQNAPENATFFLNAVDWLAQDEALISIRSKNRAPPPLVFASATLRGLVRYGNIVGVPVLLALFGALRLARRRARTRQPYRPLAGSAA